MCSSVKPYPNAGANGNRNPTFPFPAGRYTSVVDWEAIHDQGTLYDSRWQGECHSCWHLTSVGGGRERSPVVGHFWAASQLHR
jgi:hypothetical protein